MKVKLRTKCGHQVDFRQVAQFGKDQCDICLKWIRKNELIENRISQIEYLLKEIGEMS